MNIPDFPNKIKGLSHKIGKRAGEHRQVLLYMGILAVVGGFSFYLGYVAKADSAKATSVVINCPESAYNAPNKTPNASYESSYSSASQSTGGAYIASRNGKKYYPAGCSGVSRIKEENRVYFTTSALAEAAGYDLASSCK